MLGTEADGAMRLWPLWLGRRPCPRSQQDQRWIIRSGVEQCDFSFSTSPLLLSTRISIHKIDRRKDAISSDRERGASKNLFLVLLSSTSAATDFANRKILGFALEVKFNTIAISGGRSSPTCCRISTGRECKPVSGFDGILRRGHVYS